jgi:hypothetical protein
MTKERRFEIVRRPFDRFGWVFVVRDENTRRVLARSIRDYSTVDKVEDAIDKLQGADVVDTTTGGPDPFPLPVTSFRIVRGVVPLLVDEFPTLDESAFVFTEAAPAAAALQVAQTQAPAPAKPKASAKRRKAKPRKAKPRRSGSRRST